MDLLRATVCTLDPDIIGITESWCTPAIADEELTVPDYEFFRCDRKADKKGGGVLLYVKSSLKPIAYQSSSTFVDHVFCQIQDLIIGVIYRSSNYDIVGNDNNSKLCHLLADISNKHCLLMGDFNYPDIDWNNSHTPDNASIECKEFFQCIEDCFLTQHVVTPTRGESLLDLVFTCEPDIISHSEVIENLGTTDHNMVTFQLHHDCQVFETKRQCRDYFRGDYSAIKKELCSMDWDKFKSYDTITCWHKLKELLLGLEEKFIPMRKCSKNGVKKPVWMTQKLYDIQRRSTVSLRNVSVEPILLS